VPEGFTAFAGNFYRHYSERVNFAEARAVCNNVGAELASISSEAENVFVHGLEGGDRARWIGLIRTGASSFAWLDGSDLAFESWFEGEPNNFRNREDCATLGNSQFARLDGWNDANCDSDARGFVCEIGAPNTGLPGSTTAEPTTAATSSDTTSTSTSSATTPVSSSSSAATSSSSAAPSSSSAQTSTSTSTAVPTSPPTTTATASIWTQFGDSEYLYFAEEKVPQAKARRDCEALGANLAIIASMEEGTFVASLEPVGRPRWIGLKRDGSGNFSAWDDGTPVDYINFYAGQPDNMDGRENCVLMSKSSEVDVTGWDDRMCVLPRSYVCERPL
jgi:C-type mannose receptor